MTALSPYLIDRLRCPTCGESTYFDSEKPRRWRMMLGRLLFENSLDLKSFGIWGAFFRALASMGKTPDVLVPGAGQDPGGLAAADPSRTVNWTMTDVSFSSRLALVCDAHDIPFAADTFDGVVAEAVLEQVTDPWRCVEEINRVLKPGGIVLSDTPFMQQVHGGRYDYTTCTALEHRRLFRRFEELASGVSSGPGVALTWFYRHFLLGFVRGRNARHIVQALAKLASF